MDADYEPMEYEEQPADQPDGEDDSDELINEQADEEEEPEEFEESKETEEEEVAFMAKWVGLQASPVAGGTNLTLINTG